MPKYSSGLILSMNFSEILYFLNLTGGMGE